MKFYVGVTDIDWYDFVSNRQLDNVNFWKPGSDSGIFKAISPGDLFLFRLKSPISKIAGGAFLVKYLQLPLSVAWDVYGEENGFDSYLKFHTKILSYRADNASNPFIGCIVLTKPFFLPRHLWINQPKDWKPGIVQGKSYSTNEIIGAQLWRNVQESLQFDLTDRVEIVDSIVTLRIDQDERYKEHVGKERLGQSAFRTMIIDAYNSRCAMTKEKTLPVLVAGHIKPYAVSGAHDVKNGLLLRSDVHTLFDQGYLTVTSEYNIEVSNKIREEYNNGEIYYALHGTKLHLPRDARAHPGKEFLDWHNNNVFQS